MGAKVSPQPPADREGEPEQRELEREIGGPVVAEAADDNDEERQRRRA